jgi:hypothetical protein
MSKINGLEINDMHIVSTIISARISQTLMNQIVFRNGSDPMHTANGDNGNNNPNRMAMKTLGMAREFAADAKFVDISNSRRNRR